ncbi:hypothetical protein [Nodularia sp. NIES-3585]|uniref:hypothetical protein n=1 Tax=Nodularia sp. NIES-3585 TaxID=1973477 RepID=UPI000B5C8C88|nr:hypothetical protein [Nodularia sp. NIES-3585]GAX37251.1 hypothetical protein NIES3585_32940 [Nodularia sp. NIES-3585]
MPETTDFTYFATEHPNYFAGQYLLKNDFELQHKYLSDRQRYYNQNLHVSGIIEGLEVEVIQGEKAVLIKSGSAIDSKGNLIVFKDKAGTRFSDFNNITDGELYIQYFEEKQVQQQEGVADSYTRWRENPKLEFGSTTPANSIKLAKLVISGDNITLDANIREYSGLSLPNSNSQALTLRSGGNANPNLAVLSGSLKIDANLTVTGTISGNIDTGNITSGILSVDRIPNLSADKITSGLINGDLSIKGSLTVNTGGADSWHKLVVTTTSEWGDKDRKYLTIGAGGAAGIMLSNPHVTWRENQNRASIRYGRSGGSSEGSYWDVGVRKNGSFSFSLNGVDSHKLTIYENGNLTINGAITPSFGNTGNNGIMFPTNPGGGGGDAAWIRYYSRFTDLSSPLLPAGFKEQLTLEIGISNDVHDHIALMPSGGVGIGTNNPAAKLEVKGGQTILEQEAWQTPTLKNGWVNYDNTYNPAGYFKDSLGIVHLRGLVKNGSTTTTIFLLPVGYRPSNRELQAVQTKENTIGRLDIYTDGQVLVHSGNSGWFSLDGVTFRAAFK